jgi:hypothetical protein
MVELQQDPALLHCFQIQNQDLLSILPALPSSLLPLLSLDQQLLVLKIARQNLFKAAFKQSNKQNV